MTPYENEIDELLSQAEVLLQDEKPIEALALLDRARSIEPRHGWTMLFRGVALGQLGRADEAVEQLISAADEQREDIDIQVDAARHLSVLDQYQDALICAQRALTLDDADAGALAVAGEAMERLGRITEAVPLREEALVHDPTDVDSRYYLAVNLCDLGRYEEAFTVAMPLIEEFSDDPDIIRLHGACLSYLGRHHEALSRWAELERLEGITPNLLHNRASTLDVLGLHDEAMMTIDEAIALEPDIALNYYTRGMINEHRQDDVAAIEDYLAALVRDPDHLDASINLVEVAVALNVVPTVLERVDHLLTFNPTAAKLVYARGRLLMETSEMEEGIQAIELAVRLEPSLGVGWYTLTILYGMTGDIEKAVTAAQHALRFFPDDPGLWFNRGLALHDLRRYPEAMACYDRATTLAPDDPMPWLQMARMLLLDLERPADARGALKEVLLLQPDNQSAKWMLGLSCLRLGRVDEADQVAHDLIGTDPDHLWGRLVRAAMYANQGNLDAAFADLQVAAMQGYDTRLLLSEPLFEALWSDPRFDECLRGSSESAENPEPTVSLELAVTDHTASS